MLEHKFGLYQRFAWGRNNLILNWRPDLFLSRIRDGHNSTPFLYHVRYCVHLLLYFFLKGGCLLHGGYYQNHYHYHSYHCEDLVLDLNQFPYY